MAWTLILVLVSAYPLLLCATLSCFRIVEFRRHDPRSCVKPGLNSVLYILQWVVVCLLLASSILRSQELIAGHDPFASQPGLLQAELTSLTAVTLFFAAVLIPTPNEPFTPDAATRYSWLVASLLEAAKLVLFASQFNAFSKIRQDVDFALGCLRTAAFAVMSVIHIAGTRSNVLLEINDDDEVAPLLATKKPDRLQAIPKDAQSMGWLDYFLGFRVFFPYIWPSGSRKHQALAAFCFLLLIVQRVINILVPYELELLTDSLSRQSFDVGHIVLYILYRGIQGQQGIIGAFRAMLWIPISQRLFQRLSCDAFEHVLSLSLDFHLSNKMGEVVAALSKGGSLNTFFDGFVFQLFPMVLDLVVAAAYVFLRFDAVYSLIILGVLWGYIFVTINMAIYRGRAKREMAIAERGMNAAKTDAILAYETVHYSSALQVEANMFQEAVHRFQHWEFSVLLSLNGLNVIQNMIFSVGIALVTLVSAWQISQGTQSVAVFVSLLAFFGQLHAPLAFFGSFFNQVQNNLVDAERMLDLFTTQPTIKDDPDAIAYPHSKGRVAFENVSFAYNDKDKVLHDISFVVEPGTTTAIVGESGSGKSTCFKLLFRFYDPTQGRITVDQHNISRIRLSDLRHLISVVPQQQDLFHTSIANNILYSNPEATLADVQNACRVANIHDRIMTFPDQYETTVGERGLRLSGGEKQRVALARALLRNAPIMLLDEATASLDSKTETEIQQSLKRATLGRTTIIIAHRLSTITHADNILVLDKGKVVERGSHAQLLSLNGAYSRMWEKQIQGNDQETVT